MTLDFSQFGAPEEETLDFSSEGSLDFSSFATPEEEEEKTAEGDLGESFKRASGDVLQAVDMILGLPGFAAKVGATGLMDIVYSIAGSEDPAAKASEVVNKMAETPLGKYALTPTQQLLHDMGVKNIAEGTVTADLMGQLGEGIEKAAMYASDDPNRQAIVKQVAETAMLGVGGAAARIGRKTLSPKEKAGVSEADILKELEGTKEEPVFTTEPADMFPETQKTPYGTKTGEAPNWVTDEYGIPVNRPRTENLQRTEMSPLSEQFSRQGEMNRLGGEAPLLSQRPEDVIGTFVPTRDFILEPIERVKAKESGDIPYQKVTPEELRTTQGELFSPEMEGVNYKGYATPEQGIEHIQRIPTNVTQPRGEPFQPDLPGTNAPLGGVGKKGFGQGGSFTPFAKKDLTPEQKLTRLTKDEWVNDFKQRHPDKAPLAEQVYTRLKNSPAAKEGKYNLSDSAVVNALDYGLGIVSTRVGNIHPQLKQRLVDFEFYNLGNTWKRFAESEKFLEGINLFGKEDRGLINTALMKGDYNYLQKVFPKELKAEVPKVRNVLNQIGDDLVKYGIMDTKIDNYFPRIVKDLKGLYNHIGKQKAEQLQKIIAEKEFKSGPLTDVELANITNRYLQANFNRRGKPGFASKRGFQEVPEELMQYYMEPAKALDAYIRSATFQIEKAKFFGKHAVKNPETGRIDTGASVGALVIDLMNEGKIKPEQAGELASLLQSRFGRGQQASHALTQGAKDAVHIGLLGDFGNALIQNADIATSFAFDGVRPTLLSVLGKVKGTNKVSARDFGLLNHIADDFISDRLSTKAVTKTFKLSGLAKIDEITKDFVMNSALSSAQLAAKKGTKSHYLFTEYAKRFGDDFPQLLDDLREGRKTDLTDRFVFSELSNRQPISKSEYSQLYMDSPNIGRGALVLKSFMLKQADLYRNRVHNQMKSGNTREAVGNAVRLSIALATMNTAWDTIRDFLAGKPMEEFSATTLPANLFKIFGYNEYFSEKIQRGAFGEAVGDVVLPPYKAFDPLAKDISAAFDEDKEVSGKWKTFIPLIGDELYWYSEQGKEKKEQRESLMEDEE